MSALLHCFSLFSRTTKNRKQKKRKKVISMEQAGLSVSALHIHRLISKESLLSWVLVVNDWVILIWSVFRSDSFPVVFRFPIDKERSAVSFLTPLALPSVTLLACRPPLLQPSPPLKQVSRIQIETLDTKKDSDTNLKNASLKWIA